MNTGERELIVGLFDRMRPMQGIEKDAAAAELIAREAAANPDTTYLLTQSVLVQDQALQQADERIRELEGLLDEARRGAPAKASGGFLSSRPQSSVPSVGNGNATASGSRRSSGFGAPAAGSPQTAASENRQQRGPNQRASGGFMAQAMTTAAGVAGGMLLASGISSLFGNSNATAAPAENGADTSTGETGGVTPVSDTTATPADASADPAANDAVDHTQPDAAESGNWFDTGDSDWGDFGGDLDI